MKSINPIQDKGKRNIVDNPGGEQSYKMKSYPMLMKETLAKEVKRKQCIKRAKRRKTKN